MCMGSACGNKPKTKWTMLGISAIERGDELTRDDGLGVAIHDVLGSERSRLEKLGVPHHPPAHLAPRVREIRLCPALRRLVRRAHSPARYRHHRVIDEAGIVGGQVIGW